ncbi:hypothetical protein EUV02_03370 [Polymorphobacter arshaanensis]|uniref:Uncharacterized protein n=1 Tax=Glacieibacterium arshaanense TaxID=2511025 RepID=A0A4Y9ES95_9SPHN|nr:hypothetical protein [Polymorphobacter arshaanensis]TFU06069.1 hypothetical protein EUV02_03370 [Polymorphobacter arshaanensis]
MATRPGIEIRFVGLGSNEKAPPTALYALDARGGMKKLAVVDNGRLGIDPGQLKGLQLAIGPDVPDPKVIDPESLLRYRGDQVIDDWSKRGILLPQDRWSLLISEYLCVSGRVRKCRPWWYHRFAAQAAFQPKLGAARTLSMRNPALSASAVLAANKALGNSAFDNIAVLRRCVPLCDGVVEVFERHCCCTRFVYDDLIDRLRDILDRIPIEIDWPFPPGPDPDPRPWERLRPRVADAGAAIGRGRIDALRNAAATRRPLAARSIDGGGIKAAAGETFVSERIFDDYQALLKLTPDAAEAYVRARPYLTGYICNCTTRKVGEVAIGPGGRFDFCYSRPLQFVSAQRNCFTTYAYRVKQQFGPFWITVYDGVSGHDYFAQGETADLVTTNPQARPCADGPEQPDPGDGTAFVMLEHVTGASTHHYNFPVQNGLSRVGPLATDSGLYDFAGQTDAPWATTLGLRLWVSPQLEGTVAYYRFKVVPVDDTGNPVGSPTTLDSPVSWSRYIVVPGDIVTTSTSLAALPADVGGEIGLFAVPYWSSMMWLSGQYHQVWDTTKFADGRYMLTIELFGPNGVRIKPGGAPASDPGTAKPFQFRVWEAPDDTANVPFADCAHVFWINNTPVVGDIVDLRKDSVANADECQFMSGPVGTKFSVGFRAYHVGGVTTGGGPGDTNSFMASYNLTWQRGLNGPSGLIESGTADQGELVVEPSNQLNFEYLLGAFPPLHSAHTRCSFSVHLHVDAKHHNGGAFIDAYDYHETASFALQLTS